MKPVRYTGTFLVLVALAGFVVLTLARILTPSGRTWVLATSFVPFALPACVGAAVVALLVRWGSQGALRRTLGVLLALSVAGAVLHVVWLLPSYVGTSGQGRPDVTVLSLNTRFGLADPGAVAALVERERPDVIVLEEAGPTAMAALADEGIGGPGSRWPHEAGYPLEGISGTVVLSAFPLGEQERIEIDTGAYRIPVLAPKPFTLIALHTTQPLYDVGQWREDFGHLVAAARSAQGALVVAGDFNATLDHGPMRELLATGLHDAAREANSGWQPTWPSSNARPVAGLPVPWPVMAIDHVLVSKELAAISTSVEKVRGTDHLALVARLQLD